MGDGGRRATGCGFVAACPCGCLALDFLLAILIRESRLARGRAAMGCASNSSKTATRPSGCRLLALTLAQAICLTLVTFLQHVVYLKIHTIPCHAWALMHQLATVLAFIAGICAVDTPALHRCACTGSCEILDAVAQMASLALAAYKAGILARLASMPLLKAKNGRLGEVRERIEPSGAAQQALDRRRGRPGAARHESARAL